MKENYQYDFSKGNSAMFDLDSRARKAKTMVAVLEEVLPHPLNELTLLNVGGSAGVIDNYLAKHFRHVTNIDIDTHAIEHAQKEFAGNNLIFKVGDAMDMEFDENMFDVVVCSQVYEHVADAEKMMSEIHRVLRKDGVCYFAAGNRLMWNEPHYGLPLLSVIPKFLANIYVRVAKRADEYYETHFTYWGLKNLIRRFSLKDFTKPIIANPEKYHAEYMLPVGSRKQKIALMVARYFYWLVPGYIWILKK